jgi:hypothetical protein
MIINKDLTKIMEDLDSSLKQDDLLNDDEKYFYEYLQIYSIDFSEK